jgi:heat shock protein HslJ
MPAGRAMKSLLMIAVLGAGLAGCASDEVKLQAESQLHRGVDRRTAPDGLRHLTVTLDGADGRAYGNGGCNHWFAPYSLEGDKLSFGKIGSTRKLCAEALMEQEQRFFKALETVQRWDISPIEQTRFWPAEGKPLRLWLEEG